MFNFKLGRMQFLHAGCPVLFFLTYRVTHLDVNNLSFGRFRQLVGCYSSYQLPSLLPRLDGGISQREFVTIQMGHPVVP